MVPTSKLAVMPSCGTPNRPMNQIDLIPPPAHSTLVVAGADLGVTIDRLQALGVTILGYSVKLSTYTLNLIAP